jgi:serine/threonine protein phosphatase PrpC
VTDIPEKCSKCGALLDPGDAFCEECGQPVGDPAVTRAPAAALDTEANPLDDVSPISAVTARSGDATAETAAGPRAPCLECGGVVGEDGYCTQCGTKAPSARDHFEERPADWVAGICDRGIRHAVNEDAMALAAEGERAVLVVCDGVSNTDQSDVASLAAAKAALEVLRPTLPKGLGVPESAAAAVAKVFTEAAAAANRAVLATAPDDTRNPPSCTFVAAILEDGVVHHAGVGDSRAYLLPDAGNGRLLTIDDSMAQVMIAGGTPRAEAEASKQAHSITKWLGKDSPDVTPRVGQAQVSGPGWLLVCSDGLWNYASEPAALAEQIAAAGSSDPHAIATHLVAFANAAGGQDNITATLARVGRSLVEPASAASGVETDVRNNAAPNGGKTDG